MPSHAISQAPPPRSCTSNCAPQSCCATAMAVRVCRVGSHVVMREVPRARAMKMMSWSCSHSSQQPPARSAQASSSPTSSPTSSSRSRSPGRAAHSRHPVWERAAAATPLPLPNAASGPTSCTPRSSGDTPGPRPIASGFSRRSTARAARTIADPAARGTSPATNARIDRSTMGPRSVRSKAGRAAPGGRGATRSTRRPLPCG